MTSWIYELERLSLSFSSFYEKNLLFLHRNLIMHQLLKGLLLQIVDPTHNQGHGLCLDFHLELPTPTLDSLWAYIDANELSLDDSRAKPSLP